MSGPVLSTDRRGLIAAAAVAGLTAPLSAVARSGPGRERWLGSWGQALVAVPDAPALGAGTEVGLTALSSLGGRQVRLRLSNAFGTAALVVSGVSITSGGAVARLRFGGLDRIAIPAGATVLSDPADLAIAPGDRLTLSATLPEGGRTAAQGRTADRKGGWTAQGGTRSDSPPALFDTLEVMGLSRPVLVVLSDTKSAGPETWPTAFAQQAAGRVGVVNRSVFGGHLALGPAGASALARLDRDVLASAGASHVLIFAGNNDLIQPGMIGSSGRPALDPSEMLDAPRLIALLDQAVRRVRSAGLKAVGGTWLPYSGVTIAQGYSTPEKLALRDAVNAWIRKPGSFDTVIDFDAALRDPARHAWLAPRFDSGNHFTPNEAGYAEMARVALAAIR